MATAEEGSSIIEDTVECRLYPMLEQNFDMRQELLTHAMKYSQFLKEITRNYVWYFEELRISVSPTYVMVSVTFKDGIEDEWFVVSLMCQLTHHFQDVVVNIVDGDGEFLLIEAANHLPSWLKPETSINRVFIYRADVHIIPKPANPAQLVHYPAGTPTLLQALSLVRSELFTVACKPIQEVIQRRIKQQSPSHFTHCYIPVKVAHLLQHNKQLIAAAVHCLCDRDQIDIKACRKMRVFPVEQCVMSGVTFTRRLYAQLLREQFQPPRSAGFHHYGNSVAHDLGIKLTCGFEILMSSFNTKVWNCQCDSNWNHFIASLKDKGYFQGELEGSKLHKDLTEKAKQFYTKAVLQDSCGTRWIYANEAHRIMTEIPLDEHQLEQHLPPADDDKWLEITPEQLDQMIEQVQGIKLAKKVGLDSVVDGMTSFIDHVSSYEGVEFPSNTGSSAGKVTFDPDQVTGQLHDLLDDPDMLSDECFSETTSTEDDQEGEGLSHVIQQMDMELSNTTMAQSFDHLQQQKDEGLKPVDVDFNLVKNLLESYACQEGEAGPASNILQSMGIKIPER